MQDLVENGLANPEIVGYYIHNQKAQGRIKAITHTLCACVNAINENGPASKKAAGTLLKAVTLPQGMRVIAEADVLRPAQAAG